MVSGAQGEEDEGREAWEEGVGLERADAKRSVNKACSMV